MKVFGCVVDARQSACPQERSHEGCAGDWHLLLSFFVCARECCALVVWFVVALVLLARISLPVASLLPFYLFTCEVVSSLSQSTCTARLLAWFAEKMRQPWPANADTSFQVAHAHALVTCGTCGVHLSTTLLPRPRTPHSGSWYAWPTPRGRLSTARGQSWIRT